MLRGKDTSKWLRTPVVIATLASPISLMIPMICVSSVAMESRVQHTLRRTEMTPYNDARLDPSQLHRGTDSVYHVG